MDRVRTIQVRVIAFNTHPDRNKKLAYLGPRYVCYSSLGPSVFAPTSQNKISRIATFKRLALELIMNDFVLQVNALFNNIDYR